MTKPPIAPSAYSEEEIVGFVLPPELVEFSQDVDYELMELQDRRKAILELAQRQTTTIDGALAQMLVFRDKRIERAKIKYVETKRAAVKITPPIRTRLRPPN